MFRSFGWIHLGIYALATLASCNLRASDVLGAGATLPGPLYAKWAESYHRETGVKVNYQPIGSGGGVKQIAAGTVDFGATDDPVKPAELASLGLMQFPTVLAGIAVVANIRDVDASQLKLDGLTLSRIYLGEVVRWNDPQIAALNPQLLLPEQAINVVRRADGSGSTALFTEYLAQSNPKWQAQVGVAKSVNWPVGIGGKGNEGVATYVKRIPGSVGYVELLTAVKAKLQPLSLRNAAGVFVAPSPKTVSAAAANAQFDSSKGLAASLINRSGTDAWPLTATTYVLMRRADLNAPKSQSALAFFRWAARSGRSDAEALLYVPLPDHVQSQVRVAIEGADSKL